VRKDIEVRRAAQSRNPRGEGGERAGQKLLNRNGGSVPLGTGRQHACLCVGVVLRFFVAVCVLTWDEKKRRIDLI
jgi:hypothetical protein